MENDRTEGLSAFAAVMECRDEDAVVCASEDGRRAAHGKWYEDKVMGFLLDRPRSRFRLEREGTRVTITRMEDARR